MPFNLAKLLGAVKATPATLEAQMAVSNSFHDSMDGVPLSKHAKDGYKNYPARWAELRAQLDMLKAHFSDHPLPLVVDAGKCNLAYRTWETVS